MSNLKLPAHQSLIRLEETDRLLGGIALPLGLRAEGGSVDVKEGGESGVVEVLFLLGGVHTCRQAILLGKYKKGKKNIDQKLNHNKRAAFVKETQAGITQSAEKHKP